MLLKTPATDPHVAPGRTVPVHVEQPGQFLDPAVEWSCTTDSLFTPAGEIIVLRVGGQVDLVTLPALKAALDANLDQQPDHLLVDLARVTYCCARGIALLVATADYAADQGVGYAVSGVPAWLDRIWQIIFTDEPPVRYRSATVAVTAIQTRRERVLTDHSVRRGHLRSVPIPDRHAQRADRMIRVLVVHGHAFMRNAIAMRLVTAGDIALVGRCANDAEALAVVPALAPDVVLLDVSMPALGGIETTRRLRKASPGTRVVMLTTSLNGSAVPDAYQVSAVGYQLKSVDTDDLIEAVRTVHAGSEAWDKRAAAALRRRTEPVIRPIQGLRL